MSSCFHQVKGIRVLTIYRKPRPDVFEVAFFARTHVFVRAVAGRYLVVSALAQGVSVAFWRSDAAEATETRYSALTAQQLGLFDGAAWDLKALVAWLGADLRCCPVCGRAVSGRKIYDRRACKQRAYRSRK